jgi:hypothetical protein
MHYAVVSQVLTGADGPMQRGAHGPHVSGDVNTQLVELTWECERGEMREREWWVICSNLIVRA